MPKTCRALLGVMALSLCGFLAQAQAVPTLLDFNGNICGATGTEACGNGSVIGQNYGDSAGLDVSYQARTGPGPSPTAEAALRFWDTQYSDLTNIAWGVSSVGEIRLDPAPGFEVSLTSLDLGAWPNTDRSSQLTVFGDDFLTTPFSSGPIVVDGDVRSHFALNLPHSSAGYRIQWGPDSFNVGIDNVLFDVRPTDSAAVPEPASLTVLGLGLVGLAAYRWSRCG